MEFQNLKQAATHSGDEIIPPKFHEVVRLGAHLELAKGRVHEVLGNSAESFALAAGAALTGPVFWVGMNCDVGTLSPTGMERFIDPARLVMTMGISRQEVLWAGEQALRSEGISCVVIELQSGPDLKESRRLQIAAEESGALGLILIKGRAQTSAAQTRWVCEALSEGEAMWRWHCIKHKKRETAMWNVTWRGLGDGAGIIHMAAATAA